MKVSAWYYCNTVCLTHFCCSVVHTMSVCCSSNYRRLPEFFSISLAICVLKCLKLKCLMSIVYSTVAFMLNPFNMNDIFASPSFARLKIFNGEKGYCIISMAVRSRGAGGSRPPNVRNLTKSGRYFVWVWRKIAQLY